MYSINILHQTAASHILTDLSCEPDAMVVPSGENATLLTQPPWPSSFRSCLPVAASHILTDVSSEPDAMVVPSGENTTLVTGLMWPPSSPKW